MCGRFDIADGSCTGTFTFKVIEGDLYRFEAGEKSSGCGEGVDFLEVIDSDSVRYISRGDYGETEGVLQRTK